MLWALDEDGSSPPELLAGPGVASLQRTPVAAGAGPGADMERGGARSTVLGRLLCRDVEGPVRDVVSAVETSTGFSSLNDSFVVV